ncbi:MAG: PASTA domain-containing protein, partial [Coriobacteriia bacterium]|nr:PASTA domain-containing protein [Coriobacteriia bacterium]
MSRSRTERSNDSDGRQRRIMLLVAAVAAGLTLVIGGVFAWGAIVSAPASPKTPMPRLSLARVESELTTATTMEASATANNRIQVPEVTGKTVEEAEIILAAAGLSVERRETAQVVSSGTAIVVVSQTPEAGEVVDQGTVVVLRVPSVAMTATLTSAQYVVCIDPGHQAKSDLKPEPIGPGATETKGRVMGGTTGTSTKLPEYEVVLQIATNLKTRLEAAGVTVVMTRTT